MIAKMLHLDLICVVAERERTLTELRSLGVVHLDLAAASGAEVVSLKGELADAERAVRIIQRVCKETSCGEPVRAALSVADVLSAAERRETLKSEVDALAREIKIYEPYGDFDPALAKKLLERGIDLHDRLPERLPTMRLSEMQAKMSGLLAEVASVERCLATADDRAILALYPGLQDAMAFAAAKELATEKGEVAVLSGWVPARQMSALKARVAACGWGVLLREPAADEQPPTLIEPPRLFRPMTSLFAGLGIAPAYSEADVSVPFMCYFSLFFAMLVGDGAYGAIFLLGTLAARKVLPRSWFVLLTVFSASTVLWGVLSNTWFGAALPFLKGLPTVAWLADPSYANMMLLCFTIGVSHLMLARIWNGICRLPDSTAFAEFGWAGVLLMMYLVTNSIVGIFPAFPTWGLVVGGISVLSVFLFTVKPSELKTRGAELGMLPLNIMSALGDIISYVRLFAVGLASVKVAENFNNMALDLVRGDGEWWVKALLSLAMVAILVFGHVLNLAMAGLSILVHAVRLNTLEFSNHKGITWSGYQFKPFKKN